MRKKNITITVDRNALRQVLESAEVRADELEGESYKDAQYIRDCISTVRTAMEKP